MPIDPHALARDLSELARDPIEMNREACIALGWTQKPDDEFGDPGDWVGPDGSWGALPNLLDGVDRIMGLYARMISEDEALRSLTRALSESRSRSQLARVYLAELLEHLPAKA